MQKSMVVRGDIFSLEMHKLRLVHITSSERDNLAELKGALSSLYSLLLTKTCCK